jgi:D-tyrosyl-tRNA(Tyr) deacylase
MRAVVQRVRSASVHVDGREAAAIGPGLLALVGFSASDTPDTAPLAQMAHRLAGLRIFDDDRGRMGRTVAEIAGEILLIPQVTLTARLDGSRPTFHTAAPAEQARQLFDAYVREVRAHHPRVTAGVFQASMLVRLENDGPVTFVLE